MVERCFVAVSLFLLIYFLLPEKHKRWLPKLYNCIIQKYATFFLHWPQVLSGSFSSSSPGSYTAASLTGDCWVSFWTHDRFCHLVKPEETKFPKLFHTPYHTGACIWKVTRHNCIILCPSVWFQHSECDDRWHFDDRCICKSRHLPALTLTVIRQ